jgi:hypothetical protein
MSSLLRNLVRKRSRKSADYEPKARPVRHDSNGGYWVLHETNGWKRYSAKRIRLGLSA